MPYRATERTEARRLAARERVVAAAHQLIASDGYRAASIAAIAERSAVATGTVYRHFASREDLLVEVFRRASQREVDAVREAVERGGVAAGVETFSRRALAGRRLAWALLAEPVDPAVEAERLVFRRAFRDAFAGALAPSLPDRELVAAALVGAIGEALVGPLSPGNAGPGGRVPLAGVRPGGETRGSHDDALVRALVAFAERATAPALLEV